MSKKDPARPYWCARGASVSCLRRLARRRAAAAAGVLRLGRKNRGVLWLGSQGCTTHTAVVKAGSLLLLLNDDAELVVVESTGQKVDEVVGHHVVAGSVAWVQPAILGTYLAYHVRERIDQSDSD